MPQNSKKTPFSGKAKKAQLQAKRDRNNGLGNNLLRAKEDTGGGDGVLSTLIEGTEGGRRGKVGNKGERYKLQFKSESKGEVAESRERAQQQIQKVTDLTSVTEMYFDESHNLPKRPSWVDGWSKEKLEQGEQKYFRQFVTENLELEEISYFELNIETWRQFWRVTEMSDVLLLVLDIRYATATFPPALYHHVVVEMKKPLILVFNKIDLIPPALTAAWKSYFEKKFPGIHIVFFTSFPAYNLIKVSKSGMKGRKLRGNFSIAKEGALQILDLCQEMTSHDLTEWRRRVEGEVLGDFQVFDDENLLTIGTLGHPNVGKSSLINSLLGKKQVSVSKTPGHTKHFQTIHLTKTVRLCDCPGLVFPSKVPKPLQILMGSFPISQVREPYSVVLYLAERLDLPEILKIKLDEFSDCWTGFGICTSWAELRRYTTARTSRPDTYRAANQILRLALEGRICLALEPPDYHQSDFDSHPDTEFVMNVLGKVTELDEDAEEVNTTESSDDDDEELRVDNQTKSKSKCQDSTSENESGDNIESKNTFSALLNQSC